MNQDNAWSKTSTEMRKAKEEAEYKMAMAPLVGQGSLRQVAVNPNTMAPYSQVTNSKSMVIEVEPLDEGFLITIVNPPGYAGEMSQVRCRCYIDDITKLGEVTLKHTAVLSLTK